MNHLLALPEPARAAVDLARAIGIEEGLVPFLVGGPVRDLALGLPLIDVDIVVEHRAGDFAQHLTERTGGSLERHERFLTFKIAAAGFPPIDVATARSEFYPVPGALPTVRPAPLFDDLMRRDFSMNAIALDVIGGGLRDPASGLADIDRRRVRVLHDRSFIDDPTRMFRAVRFASRLRFTIEPLTHRLLDDAVDRGALATVSRPRLWRELFLAMNEEHPGAVICALLEQRLLEFLLGVAVCSDETRRLLLRIDDRIASWPSVDAPVVYLAAILFHSGSPPGSRQEWRLSKRRVALIEAILNDAEHVRQMVERGERRELLALLDSSPPELLVFVSALSEQAAARIDADAPFIRYALPLSGRDLHVAPGLHLARALAETKRALYLGEIAPEEALSFARARALQYLTEKTDGKR